MLGGAQRPEHFYDLRNATNAVYVPEIEQATHKYSLSAKKGESI